MVDEALEIDRAALGREPLVIKETVGAEIVVTKTVSGIVWPYMKYHETFTVVDEIGIDGECKEIAFP
jgi:hypothetical protein